MDAFEILNEDFDNGYKYSDGHIYARICSYRRSDRVNENRWWARLSKSKQGVLRRFLNHSPLATAFAKVLLQIPGMRDGLQIGSLPEMSIAKCPEVPLPRSINSAH